MNFLNSEILNPLTFFIKFFWVLWLVGLSSEEFLVEKFNSEYVEGLIMACTLLLLQIVITEVFTQLLTCHYKINLMLGGVGSLIAI